MAKKPTKPEATENAHKVERQKRARKAAIVLPTYSLKAVETGDSFSVRILTPIYSKPDMDEKTGEQKKDKKGAPAYLHLVQVEDLDTGELGEMVLPIIIYNALDQLEKQDALPGRGFEFVKGRAEANKATKWEVYELEI